MSAWWSALKLLLPLLPDIVKALKRGEAWFELRLALGKVDHALEQARTTKDTHELEDLLHGKPGDRIDP